MSIASQITTMQEHIENIYDTFAVAGVDTSVAAKNIVNINANLKERLEYYLANGLDVVWNNWNKVSGSGTTLSLNNTIQAKMKIDLKGNTYQYSTTGKNLFNVNATHENNLEEAGITATFNNDGTITVNGTKNANYKFIFYNITLPAGTYYFSGCPSGGWGGGYSAIVQTTNEISSQVFDIGNGGTFTLTEEKTIAFFPIRVGADAVTLNNTVFKPMIARVPVTYNDYEPYTNGASPNPDYPQVIHTITGDNEVKVEGKQLFQREYIGVPARDINAVLTSGTYTLASCDSNNFGKNIYFKLFDENNNIITTGGHLTATGVQINFSTNSYSYYGGANQNKITFTLDNDYRLNIGLLDSDVTRQVMLVKGDTEERTYTPYVSQSYPISLGVENLINPALFTTTGSYNVASINNGEVIGNSITGYAGVRIALGQNINLKTNDEIYVRLKLKSDVAGDVFNTIQVFNSSNTGITSTEVKLSTPTLTTEYQEYIIKYTIGTDETLNKLFIQHKGSSSNVFTIKDIQVSYVNGSYTPYGTTPIELCKIGDYQDKIAKSTGKNLFDKNNANILNNAYLNNSQSKIASGDGNKVLYISIEGGKTYTISKIASSRFAVATTSTLPSINTTTIDKEQDNSATHITLNTSINAKYLCVFYLYSADTINEQEILNSIQIEKGSTATPYEPYGKVWYLNKQIGKVVLDGSETINTVGTNDNNYSFRIDISDIIPTNNFDIEHPTIISDLFKIVSYSTVYNNQDEGIAQYYNTSASPTKRIYINISKSRLTYITTWASAVKNWLQSNNVLVYYVLETPTITEITDTTLIGQLDNIENAYSYDTQTNITQTNDDMPFILDVTALKDLDAEDATPTLTTNRGLLFTQPPVSENFINDEDDNSILEETINEEEPNIEDDNREEEEPVDFLEKK